MKEFSFHIRVRVNDRMTGIFDSAAKLSKPRHPKDVLTGLVKSLLSPFMDVVSITTDEFTKLVAVDPVAYVEDGPNSYTLLRDGTKLYDTDDIQ